MAGEPDEAGSEEEGSDVYAVKRGYISITPIHFDLTNYALIENLQKINWDI